MNYGPILQILQAQSNWEAVFAASDRGKKITGSFYTRPLVGWALVEVIPPNSSIGTPNSRQQTVVVGMVAIEDSHVLDLVDMVGDFLGYQYPGCQTDWHTEAVKFKNKIR